MLLKKCVSVFLALLLVFSLGAFAFAEEEDDRYLGEYTDADIGTLIDKIAACVNSRPVDYGTSRSDDSKMLAMYRSGRAVDESLENAWLAYNAAKYHQISNYPEDDLYFALAAGGFDIENFYGRDFLKSCKDENGEAHPENWTAKYDEEKFDRLILSGKGTSLDSAYREYYDEAIKVALAGASGTLDVREGLTSSTSNMGKRGIEGNYGVSDYILLLHQEYGKGNEAIDTAIERALRYEVGESNNARYSKLIRLLAICGYDAAQKEIYLPTLGETLDISIDGKSPLELLLSQLCGENGELCTNREAALACDKLAVTYTEYEYNVGMVVFDVEGPLSALVAYECYQKGEDFYDFSGAKKREPFVGPNRLPELQYYDYKNPGETKVIAPGQSMYQSVNAIFEDPDDDELTYWVSVNGGEKEQITLTGSPEYAKDTSSYSEEKKVYFCYTHDKSTMTGDEQVITLALYAKDEEGFSPAYTVTVEVYTDPTLHWITYAEGESAVTITGCAYNATDLLIPETINGKTVTNIAMNAFVSKPQLETVQLPDTVLTIGKDAFSGCRRLRSCNLPASLTRIGERAFEGCQKLEEVTLPAGIVEFPDDCFYGCTRLKFSVSEENEVFSAENSTLYSKDKTVLYCAGHREDGNFVIPDSVVTIGDGAFRMTELDSVTFGKSVKTIGEEAFAFCSAETFTFNEGLEEIGREAFAQAEITNYSQLSGAIERGETGNLNFTVAPSRVRELVFPSTLTTLGEAVFASAMTLERIDLSKTQLTELPERTFLGTTSVKELLLPEGVTYIGDYCFALSGLESIELPDTVRYIGEGTFKSCDSLTLIDFGESLHTVGEEAFYYANFEKMTFPRTLKKLDTTAHSAYFEGNRPEGVTSSSVPENYRLENAYDWDGGNSEIYEPTEGEKRLILSVAPEDEFLAPLDISDPIRVTAAGGADGTVVRWQSSDLSVAAVDENGCVIAVGDGTATITAYSADAQGSADIYVADSGMLRWEVSWDDTVAITGGNFSADFDGSLVIPETLAGKTVTAIKWTAFEYNDKITSVSLPDTIKSIGGRAFCGCQNLAEINIPDGVESIGNFAFASTALQTVSLPQSLLSLGHNSFAHIDTLTSVTIDCPNLSEDFGENGTGAFTGNEALTELNLINIPEIGQGMFSNCTSLESVKLPESLKAIDAYAFRGCASLVEVDMPKYLVNSYYYSKDSENAPFYGTAENFTLLHPDDGNMWDNYAGAKNVGISGMSKDGDASPRVFEIVRDAFVENPVLLTAICAVLLLLIAAGALHRSRKAKQDR